MGIWIWISSILAAVVAAFQIWQMVLDHQLKGLPENHKRKKRSLRQKLLVIGLILLIVNQLVVVLTNIARESKASDERAVATNQQAVLIARISNLNSNQERFQVKQVRLEDQNQQLISALATNRSIDPELRMKVVQQNRQFEVLSNELVDLESLMSGLERKNNAAAIEREMAEVRRVNVERTEWVDAWEATSPMFDHTIRTLQSNLLEIGKRDGAKLLSDFKTLPLSLPDDGIKITSISFGTNLGWRFDGVIKRGASRPQLELIITASCTNHSHSVPLTLLARHNGEFNRTVYDVRVPDASFRQIFRETNHVDAVKGAIGQFLAAHGLQCIKAGSPK